MYSLFVSQYPITTGLIICLFSLCIGSFLNVVIYRLPIMLNQEWTILSSEFLNIKVDQTSPNFNLVKPVSTCPNCQTAIKPRHNIPVLSYLLLGGKCSQCHNPISIRYPLVEVSTALLTLVLYSIHGVNLTFFVSCLFCYFLIALAMIDIDTQLLPDNLTLSLLWLGLITNSFEVFIPLRESVFSAAGAYLCLRGFVALFNLITGKEGMGHGDFKLFAVFGAWFGYLALPFILVISSFVGAIIGIIHLKLSKQGSDTPIAFGPYLCLAALIYLFWGQTIINWYLNLLFV